MTSRKKPTTPSHAGPLNPLDCELRHAIILRVEQLEGPLPLDALVKLLSDATSHFNGLSGTINEARFDPRVYEAVVEYQGDILAKVHLREPEHRQLTITLWKESLANAWSNAQTLNEIRQNQKAYRTAIHEDPEGWISQVLKTLSKTGNEMQAFALKMQWDRNAERRQRAR